MHLGFCRLFPSRRFKRERDRNSGKKLAKGLGLLRFKKEVESKALALSLSDATAARIIRSAGKILVTPSGLVESPKPKPSIQVSVGWAVVSVPTIGERAAFTAVRGAKHFARASRTNKPRERLFYHGHDIGDDYFQAYVQACGIPTLADLEQTLITPKGGPLSEQAESSAKKRAVLHGYGHGLEDGWFMRLYRQQGGLCALSGLPMVRRNGTLCECLPVPDRIDSNQGYFPGNVRLVRHGLNMMRRDRDDATFARLCASMFLLRVD